MAHVHSPVSRVATPQHPNQRTTPTTRFAPPTITQLETNYIPTTLVHGQDALSAVQGSKPPHEPSATAASSVTRGRVVLPTQHVGPVVTRVASRFDEAAAIERINAMSGAACGLLDMWPLSKLFRLWGDSGRKVEELAAAAQVQQAPDAIQEDDMMRGAAPPAYEDYK
ncbi:hypothetical protein FRB90_000033 [Tulasnella sp. 427]|nr:hypothetical protein FRB90_000033 [Tulasnella sp. 427]